MGKRRTFYLPRMWLWESRAVHKITFRASFKAPALDAVQGAIYPVRAAANHAGSARYEAFGRQGPSRGGARKIHEQFSLRWGRQQSCDHVREGARN